MYRNRLNGLCGTKAKTTKSLIESKITLDNKIKNRINNLKLNLQLKKAQAPASNVSSTPKPATAKPKYFTWSPNQKNTFIINIKTWINNLIQKMRVRIVKTQPTNPPLTPNPITPSVSSTSVSSNIGVKIIYASQNKQSIAIPPRQFPAAEYGQTILHYKGTPLLDASKTTLCQNTFLELRRGIFLNAMEKYLKFKINLEAGSSLQFIGQSN